MKAFRSQPSIFTSARPEEKQAELEVINLTLNFGGITALNNINLKVNTGELLTAVFLVEISSGIMSFTGELGDS